MTNGRIDKQSFLCTLPMPPSVNGLFAGMQRRHKSDEYKAWLSKANSLVWLYSPHCTLPLKGRIKATYIFHFNHNDLRSGTKRKNDIFNREKALSDFLVACGVIEDDSDIDDGRVIRGNPVVAPDEPFVDVNLEVL